jgi:hypothetical protein
MTLDAISFLLMLGSASALGFSLALRGNRRRCRTRVRLLKHL